MLSRSEQDTLRRKILEYRPQFENIAGRSCLLKALELYNTYSGGVICWVGGLARINLDLGIHHAYFFPPQFRDRDIALNLADNGFPEYPPLTKREALAIGIVQNPNILRQNIVRSVKNL